MSDKEKPRRRAPGQPWYQASFDAPDNNLYFVLAFLAVVVSLAFYADYGLRTHLGSAPNTGEIKSRFFDYSVTSITGEEWNLGELKGKVGIAISLSRRAEDYLALPKTINQFPELIFILMIYLISSRTQIVLAVNVASKCGFTNQYPGLENLYQTYKNRGLVVIGFPCNQFGGQEPAEEEEILTFCQSTYDVSFPLTQKMYVNPTIVFFYSRPDYFLFVSITQPTAYLTLPSNFYHSQVTSMARTSTQFTHSLRPQSRAC
ncbi:glutathione peroxidase-domain-containing protein [Jimgerdemannia flammicorona]|uniref:Glutathione peroxidase n=1 Tax=Jimgerdemannia flammicorona TaxID=994334 RepID=A0A433A1P0_9FUNG|nr:glutathione peroxidase-domain-containing protein [Jimgerdemannia flammicorona]